MLFYRSQKSRQVQDIGPPWTWWLVCRPCAQFIILPHYLDMGNMRNSHHRYPDIFPHKGQIACQLFQWHHPLMLTGLCTWHTTPSAQIPSFSMNWHTKSGPPPPGHLTWFPPPRSSPDNNHAHHHTNSTQYQHTSEVAYCLIQSHSRGCLTTEGVHPGYGALSHYNSSTQYPSQPYPDAPLKMCTVSYEPTPEVPPQLRVTTRIRCPLPP